ncbi:hypothetical protein [Alkalicoccus chagannorensis]|uniref:hypothetical protein n=1 Tax=Alkalicoccus chagannorensis TaxID=427072 RepID=UPI00040E94EB|nr:hypothetical protein [Alkalicoccus chagannorensis]
MAADEPNQSGPVFIKYAFITIIVIIILFFLMNFLPFGGGGDEDDGGNNDADIEIDVDGDDLDPSNNEEE